LQGFSVSVFETTIRIVGGLLSAYDFTEDPLFLEKAEEVVKKLLPAFKTPSRIPKASVNLQRLFSF
jgi:mannosyl-oligosaccharide alpha-1,2-mannosidase